VIKTEPENKWKLQITEDEIRGINDRLKWAMYGDETSALGHILLEINGIERTWISSNGTVTLSMRTTGALVEGCGGSSALQRVQLHARLFKRIDRSGGVIHVIDWGEYRELEFDSNGLVTRLVEPPERFPDWRQKYAEVDGPTVGVCPNRLRNAIVQAATLPEGVNLEDGPVHTWVHGVNGLLRFHTPWVNYFDTEVDIAANARVPDTPAALLDVHATQCAIHLMDDISGDITVTLPSTPMSPMRLRAAEFDALVLPIDRWIDERNTLTEALCTMLQVDAVQPDEDGDYPITMTDHAVWARLETSRNRPIVQVFSILANGVPKSQELFEELNSINRIERFVRLVWTGSSLGAEASLTMPQVDPFALNYMFREVERVATRYQDILAAYFADPGQTETLF